MEKFSPMAQEYLENYEILRQARKRFDEELTDWWRSLMKEEIYPRLKTLDGIGRTWENQSSPGQLEVHTKKKNLSVMIYDPRHNGTRDYQINIRANKPVLKKLRDNHELTEFLQSQDKLNFGTLFPTEYSLMIIPVEIRGTDPKETFKEIKQKFVTLFELSGKIEEYL